MNKAKALTQVRVVGVGKIRLVPTIGDDRMNLWIVIPIRLIFEELRSRTSRGIDMD